MRENIAKKKADYVAQKNRQNKNEKEQKKHLWAAIFIKHSNINGGKIAKKLLYVVLT